MPGQCSVPGELMEADSKQMAGKLTPRQERFVHEYLIDFNGAGAYRRAGYKARNDNVAAANASLLIRSHKVKFAIQTAMQAHSQRAKLTAEWVLEKLQIEAEGTHPPTRVKALELLG